MKKVISFSLWGNNPIYTIGAIKNAELTPIIYPGWISRFYCGKSVPSEIIEQLKKIPTTEVILMEENGNWEGMFWRFYACDDSDIMLSRDTDSRLNLREKFAVNEWLNSEKDFHIMRDHPYHSTQILGGMWGCRNGILRNIKFSEVIEKWNRFEKKGADQDFLGSVIYPFVKDRSLEHSDFNLRFGGEIKPFPTIRNNYEFVGDVFDENNIRHPEYWKIIKVVNG